MGRTYELDFRLISKLKKHFGIEKIKVKKINKLYFCIIFVSTFIPLFMIPQTLIMAFTPSLLVNTKPTGWFWINNNDATEFSFLNTNKNPRVSNQEMCKNGDMITEPTDKNSVKTICNSFTNKEDIEYINENIKSQLQFFILY